eukprot:7359008-Prymnesium_polylepis.1
MCENVEGKARPRRLTVGQNLETEINVHHPTGQNTNHAPPAQKPLGSAAWGVRSHNMRSNGLMLTFRYAISRTMAHGRRWKL